MITQVNRPGHLPLLLGGIAAILVSGIAIASMAISARGFDGVFAPAAAAETAAAPAIDARRCSECGMIESTRQIGVFDAITGADPSGRMAARNRVEIGARPPPNYEITIRMRDGSMRVIRDAKPAKWRHGEPVTIIAGVD